MKKITLRLPDELHTQLCAVAQRQHRSVHAQVLMAIEVSLMVPGAVLPVVDALPHVCAFCKDGGALTCSTVKGIGYRDGLVLRAVPYRLADLPLATPYCPGCGVRVAAPHHAECPHEVCPRCQALLSSCSCMAMACLPLYTTDGTPGSFDPTAITLHE